MSGVQLGFGIVLTVVGLVLLPFSRRVGRYMDEESARLQDGAPGINRIFVQQSSLNSEQVAPLGALVLTGIGVALIVTAFTAH